MSRLDTAGINCPHENLRKVGIQGGTLYQEVLVSRPIAFLKIWMLPCEQ